MGPLTIPVLVVLVVVVCIVAVVAAVAFVAFVILSAVGFWTIRDRIDHAKQLASEADSEDVW